MKIINKPIHAARFRTRRRYGKLNHDDETAVKISSAVPE